MGAAAPRRGEFAKDGQGGAEAVGAGGVVRGGEGLGGGAEGAAAVDGLGEAVEVGVGGDQAADGGRGGPGSEGGKVVAGVGGEGCEIEVEGCEEVEEGSPEC